MRNIFVKFAAQDKLNVSVEEIEITAIHDLPKRKDGTTPVIVQLLSVDKKTDLMRKRKQRLLKRPADKGKQRPVR